MACQILDIWVNQSMNQPSNQRINPSIDQLINQLALGSEAIYFFGRPGANYGGRRGASPRPTARADRRIATFQLRLKIALFFDTLFLAFLVDPACQDAPKINKIHEKINFKIALDFRIVFDTIFH